MIDGETIAHAHTLNLNIRCVDFIKVNGVDFDTHSIHSHTFDSIAFTSANAVKYFFGNQNALNLLRGKNIFSLAGKTSEELARYNLKAIYTGENADDLAEVIIQAKLAKSVLHFCGNLTLEVLGAKLKGAGIEYSSLIIYQTILQNKIVLNEDFDVVMFYSPSGVESFFAANKLNNENVCCCIGETTAMALRKKNSTAKIILPRQPSLQSIIEAIAKYFQNSRIEL